MLIIYYWVTEIINIKDFHKDKLRKSPANRNAQRVNRSLGQRVLCCADCLSTGGPVNPSFSLK